MNICIKWRRDNASIITSQFVRKFVVFLRQLLYISALLLWKEWSSCEVLLSKYGQVCRSFQAQLYVVFIHRRRIHLFIVQAVGSVEKLSLWLSEVKQSSFKYFANCTQSGNRLFVGNTSNKKHWRADGFLTVFWLLFLLFVVFIIIIISAVVLS